MAHQQIDSMAEKRFHPPGWLLAAVAAMVVLRFLPPRWALTPFPWSLIGIAPLLVGIGANLWADRAFKVSDTTVKPGERPSALITDGAYRFTRHPMYIGMLLVLIGVAILLGRPLPWIVVPAFAVVVRRFMIMEEDRMEAEFGEAYREYAQHVRRWL